MTEREILGKNIKRGRLLSDLSRDELGEKIGLTGTTIARLERGDEKYVKNIGLSYLLKIAKELDIPIEEFFMPNPEQVSVKFTLAENNLEAFRKLLGRVEYLMQIKKEVK